MGRSHSIGGRLAVLDQAVKERCPRCGGSCVRAGVRRVEGVVAGGPDQVVIFRCEACRHEFVGPPFKQPSRRR